MELIHLHLVFVVPGHLEFSKADVVTTLKGDGLSDLIIIDQNRVVLGHGRDERGGPFSDRQLSVLTANGDIGEHQIIAGSPSNSNGLLLDVKEPGRVT